MSAASTPAPRDKSSSQNRSSGPRYTMFLPMLIFLFGSGTLALYQIMAMEDELDDLTQTIDKMDGRIKHAQHEKAVFYKIAGDVLRLAPKDPNAEKVVLYFKLDKLAAAQPELLSSDALADPAMAAAMESASSTNAPAATPGASTNAPASVAPAPASK